jgi:ribonucleoside-triphosphate reductase (formate)
MRVSTSRKKKIQTLIVIKRSGETEPYNLDRIARSIFKAADFVGGSDKQRAHEIAVEVDARIRAELHSSYEIETSRIRDIVKQTLLDFGHGKTSVAYELHSDVSNRVKNIKSLIDAQNLVGDYINQLDWRVNENGNMAYSWQGLNNHIFTSVQANYWLHTIYDQDVRDAHINADLHIHDLGMLTVYCCGWSLQDLLLRGFTGVPGKVTSKPAKHFPAALGQIVNFFYTLQGEAAGAQAFSSFDTYLAPFIYYDKLSYKQVKQHLQEFLFNMNVPTRVGFQTPFTNVTMDVVPSGQLAEEAVIIGGKYMDRKYKDFQKEMDMFNKAFAELMMEGDGISRVFSFPIPTYNITKNFDWENETLLPVWEMTAKFGIPYFSNFISSDMNPDDARSMCCRLRIDNRELKKRGGGLFGSNPLTGSIGVVTINLPRIGYLSKNKKEYFDRLGKLMDIARKSLDVKRSFIEDYTEKGLYPYAKYYMSDIKARFGEYWRNHFNTIGINGLNESLMNFLGEDITTKKGKEFGLEVMDFMREKLADYQNESNELFNLEATPAESTAYRFAKADIKLYPDIITANHLEGASSSDPYYTNSSHLPVGYTNDPYQALDLQDEFQTKYTGGTVVHLFLGERMPNPEAVKSFVRKVAHNYALPYFSITPTFSICPKHGYLDGEHEYCPKCDIENGYVDEVLGNRKNTDIS